MGISLKPASRQFVGGFLLGVCGLAFARAGDTQQHTTAAVIKAVLDCRVVVDPTPRLSCFDQSVARLAEAEASGQIVIIDREQVRAVRREAFGFNLPRLSIFDRAGKTEPLERLTTSVESAHQAGDGKWIITVEGGAVWRQIDSEQLSPPRHGAKADIRKATMGTFFMSVDGARSIRVERVS